MCGVYTNYRQTIFYRKTIKAKTPSSKYRFLLSKIIHWIIFEVNLYSQSVLGTLFSCKRVPNLLKCAFADKVFRTLLSATKDSVFGICELFVKSSTKNFIFISTTRLRAVGELSPASSWKKDALFKSILFLFLILLQNILALHFRPEP